MAHFKCLLMIILVCGHLLSAYTAQVPLLSGKNDKPDNSNLILASLHSLLKSWSQAYAPHGHAIIPATIKSGTLLYHMGRSPPPIGMDWFAYVISAPYYRNSNPNDLRQSFDAEHSYLFGGGFTESWLGQRYASCCSHVPFFIYLGIKYNVYICCHSTTTRIIF